ncbi:unnamed protein product [Penicillium olsonii]|nr:unnamed protein product [Penicillium olsonii]CAG7916724.1 unnamed protein product [Penicillium olsonii]
MATSPAPTHSAIPHSKEQEPGNIQPSEPSESSTLPRPKIRLHVEDVRHPASSVFLAFIPDVASVLDRALANIVEHLYTPSASKAHDQSKFTPSIPPTRSVTVFLRDYSGVAYTTGTELDDAHKEIHVSLPYVQHCTSGPGAKDDPLHELVGVLTHELVHCYQHTAPPGSSLRPPGGLIEGIADFVRLKAGLEPPHWKKPANAAERPPKWDMGYQHTAYFLAWLEDVKVGKGIVGRLNDRLLRVGYVGEDKHEGKGAVGFWKGLLGAEVGELWEEYGRYLDDSTRGKTRGNWEEEIVNPE